MGRSWPRLYMARVWPATFLHDASLGHHYGGYIPVALPLVGWYSARYRDDRHEKGGGIHLGGLIPLVVDAGVVLSEAED